MAYTRSKPKKSKLAQRLTKPLYRDVGQHLDQGRHTVQISEKPRVEKDYVIIKVQDTKGRQHTDCIWIRDFIDQEKKAFKFKSFMSCFGLIDTKYIDLIEEDISNVRMFSKMVFDAEIGHKHGYLIATNPRGEYVVTLNPSGDQLGTFRSVKEASSYAKDRGFKPAYRYIEKYIPRGDYAEFNRKLFDTYIKEKFGSEIPDSVD